MTTQNLVPNPRFNKMAQKAADDLLKKLGITRDEVPDTLIITGTGWGDVIIGQDLIKSVKRSEVAGFSQICDAPGHAGTFGIAKINGMRVALTNGRLHMWQSAAAEDPRRVIEMVRLQHEMWAVLGVKNMIVTCGAGSLHEERAPEGAIVVISDTDHGDITLPFEAFVTPSAVINPFQLGDNSDVLWRLGDTVDQPIGCGPYRMVHGPVVESLSRKRIEAAHGHICIGMSVVPALCIAHLYGFKRTIALAYITNGMVEVLDGEANARSARENSVRLYEALDASLCVINDRTD